MRVSRFPDISLATDDAAGSVQVDREQRDIIGYAEEGTNHDSDALLTGGHRDVQQRSRRDHDRVTSNRNADILDLRSVNYVFVEFRDTLCGNLTCERKQFPRNKRSK